MHGLWEPQDIDSAGPGHTAATTQQDAAVLTRVLPFQFCLRISIASKHAVYTGHTDTHRDRQTNKHTQTHTETDKQTHTHTDTTHNRQHTHRKLTE